MTRQGNCLRKNPVANVHWWSTRMANERTQWPHRHSSAMVKTRGKEYPPPPSAQKSSRTPARKVKNKVGSPAARASQGLAAIAVASSSAQVEDNYTNYDPSSDEFEFSDEDEPNSRSASPFASASVTSETSTDSRSKLPLNLQLTLLKDIQSAGGIDKFHLGSSQALSFLCDSRPELYGARGDKVRNKIGKKVQRWKLLEKDQWLGLLLDKKVTELPSKNHPNNEKPIQDSQEAVNSSTRATTPGEARCDNTKPASLFPSKSVATVITTSTKPAATNMSSTAENTRKCSSLCSFLCCLAHIC
jgi:hypothetical protein